MRPAIVIPWQHVQHDNHRLMPARPRKGQYTARLITSPAYRIAKTAAEYTIKAQWNGRVMLKGALTLTARCYFPDNRKRDAGNYRKLATDAMSGICYDDDAQLESETWIRAGIDKKNPRIEIEISELDADFTERKPEKRLKPSAVERVPIQLPGLGLDGKVPKRNIAIDRA